jgi:rhodanese-related sulfurtransferase
MDRSPGAVPQIDVKSAFDQWKSGEIMLVDVREQDEWNQGHIEGITFIPLGQLPYRWRELDPEQRWICVCRSGNRSHYAAALLRQAGIDAANLAGGMVEWHTQRLPVSTPNPDQPR